MQDFKLNIYKKDTGNELSGYTSLNLKNCKERVDEISILVGLSSQNQNLFVALEKHLQFKDFDEDDTYNIELLINDFGLSQKESFFVVWSENEIDEVNTDSLLSAWEYLWYSDSDEAIILFQRFSRKVILITHYGRIFYN